MAMTTEIFLVHNIKCDGCASIIRSGLATLEGVESVDVVVDTGSVTVSASGVSREQIEAKLVELGYPEI